MMQSTNVIVGGSSNTPGATLPVNSTGNRSGYSPASNTTGQSSAVPNPLNIYASYNYIFTLSSLSIDEVNNPKSTYRINEPSEIILRSGGSGNAKIPSEQESQLGITADLYIDDVEIYSIIGNNPNTKHSTVAVSLLLQATTTRGMLRQRIVGRKI